jgi:hypothetical protein
MTVAAAEAAICTFFDEMWHFRVEPSSVASTPATGFSILNKSKSPRVASKSKSTKKEHERLMNMCLRFASFIILMFCHCHEYCSLISPLLVANHSDWACIFRARASLVQSCLSRDVYDAMLNTALTMTTAASSSQLLDGDTSAHLTGLVRFLQSHAMDVDSALVGIEPNAAWRSVFTFSRMSVSEDVINASSSGGDRRDGLANNVRDFNSLSERIVAISSLGNAEAIEREVIALAQVLKREELR